MHPSTLKKLKLAEELTVIVKKFIPADKLIELAKNQIIPCYILTDPTTKENTYLFISNEVEEWITKNIIVVQNGFNFVTHNIYMKYDSLAQVQDNIPDELLGFVDLHKLDLSTLFTPSGVYFLCKEDKVVYIGQAINVGARITSHISENKKSFDRIFYVRVPLNELNAVEGTLIRIFRPPLNGNTAPILSKDEMDRIMKHYHINYPNISGKEIQIRHRAKRLTTYNFNQSHNTNENV